MPARVTLTVTQGNLQTQAFTFAERTTCIVGRGDDGQPQLPNDENHRTTSRYHCLLDINPPDIRIRDSGSMDGTLVNRRMIGHRPVDPIPEEGVRSAFPEYGLNDGNAVQLGNNASGLGMVVPVVCAEHSAEARKEVR
jgi:pSer/pThr/pTyr-binding forkhead associated (FHA) protein